MKTQIVKPYSELAGGKKEQVATMFDNISRHYDFLNHLLSMGIDRRWRKKAIGMLENRSPQRILDVASGTGDFALEAIRINPEKIIGIDISVKMLEIGRKKIENLELENKIELQIGDAENLQFDNEYFDTVTVAFGVRNFERLTKGLSEISRVLKPGGEVVVLEFSRPNGFPLKQAFKFYFSIILPFIGALVSKDRRAYQYLHDSVEVFPQGKVFCDILMKCGFESVREKRLVSGIATIYIGKK